MTEPTHTDRILRQAKALVRAIEALGTIDPTGPVERAAARLLLYAYRRRLRGVVEVALRGWSRRRQKRILYTHMLGCLSPFDATAVWM